MQVKICGITHPDDAVQAARAGADYVGMIFATSSKRLVDLSTAKKIAEAAREFGAEPVAVFNDQTAEQIIDICIQTGIKTVQLHEAGAKAAFDLLKEIYSIIYRLADFSQTAPPGTLPLYDPSSGTGKRFDWASSTPPKNRSWMLAGGLTPENVSEAISLLHPTVVDAASGVEFPQKLRKDPALVEAFIKAAKKRSNR